MKNVAIILTCYNRVEITLACLNSLYISDFPNRISKDIYLVDDNSPDGTGKIVKEKYQKINVIQGTGSLFWNGGMRLAWDTAARCKEYDFYLWLNDDIILEPGSIKQLFDDFEKVNEPSIITAACNSKNTNSFTYGGRNESGPVLPNGQPQICKFINGNMVLVPKVVYQTVGNLSPKYTHSLGDFDYGLRAQKAGFSCYTTSEYLASCETNPLRDWCNPNISLLNRIELFMSPRGLNFAEYFYFTFSHFGLFASITASLKAFFRVLLPSTYNYIKGI